MSKRVLLRPRAEIDILDHEAFLFEESPPTADRASQGRSLVAVDDFPAHLIIYREIEDGIDLLRVVHAARDITRFTEDLE